MTEFETTFSYDVTIKGEESTNFLERITTNFLIKLQQKISSINGGIVNEK